MRILETIMRGCLLLPLYEEQTDTQTIVMWVFLLAYIHAYMHDSRLTFSRLSSMSTRARSSSFSLLTPIRRHRLNDDDDDAATATEVQRARRVPWERKKKSERHDDCWEVREGERETSISSNAVYDRRPAPRITASRSQRRCRSLRPPYAALSRARTPIRRPRRREPQAGLSSISCVAVPPASGAAYASRLLLPIVVVNARRWVS